MSKKQILFVLYDLGISLASLSRLFKEANEEQLNQVLEGDFLEVQFSLGIFNDRDINLLSSFEEIQKSRTYISKILHEFVNKNIEYYIYYEKDFPESLKNIPSPPFFIFMKGKKSLLDNNFICSVVGTRNPKAQTLMQIDNVVQEMVLSNIVVASGLAIGTDIHAHKSTLINNGKTIAVLPSPIDNITPSSHKVYANEIIEKDGLLISEYYKNDTVFKKTNYIYRNRIISGISNAVIIAECSERSGTMHTARYAYKQKKPLYCFDNNSSGILKILSSNSARIYTNITDLKL